MRSFIWIAVAWLFLGLAAPAGAIGPKVRSEAWQAAAPIAIVPASDRCVALSVFRRGGESLRFALEARPTTDKYEMLIEAPGRLGNKPWIEGKILLGDSKPERDVVVVEASARANSVIYLIKTKRSELEAAGADPELQVSAQAHTLDLSVVGLGAALPALDACSSELLMNWGYSKELQHRLTSYPRPKRQLSTYALSSDYPPAAARIGAMGEAHVLVSIGTNGRASNCRIIRSSGHADIDAVTCKIATKRVDYEPAKMSDGALAVAPAYLTMRWELPR